MLGYVMLLDKVQLHCPTKDGITAAFSAQMKQAAESRHLVAAARGRRMKPDPSRLLAARGCAALRSGEEREVPEHHGGGVQVLLCCNLGCRDHGHSSRETNHFCFTC